MAKNGFAPERIEFFGQFVRCLGSGFRTIESSIANFTAEQRNAIIQEAREELHRVDTMLAKLMAGGAPAEEPVELLVGELQLPYRRGMSGSGAKSLDGF